MRSISLFENPLAETPVTELSGGYSDNRIFVKRDDMIPFSFGGNKARKAAEFYKEIKNSTADVVVTYGSNSSNHCRIIANMAAGMGLACHIISPEENREILYNTKMVEQFGAVIETCPVENVSETIEYRCAAYRREGKTPYFIAGGGHGNPGTHAYVKCYQEILRQEAVLGETFDHIFHASGTGTTQAGLVCGSILNGDDRKIVGISIAREESRGRQVVQNSISEYLSACGKDGAFDLGGDDQREKKLIFTDAYRTGGYGKFTPEIQDVIRRVMKEDGIPMDTTYVGKAFCGMLQYLRDNEIKGQNILFIHTGGAPLFFDRL